MQIGVQKQETTLHERQKFCASGRHDKDNDFGLCLRLEDNALNPKTGRSQNPKKTLRDCLMISPIRLVVGLFVIQIPSRLHLLIYDSTRPQAEKNSWHHLIVEWTWRVPTIANSLFVEAGFRLFAKIIRLSCSSCIKSFFGRATKLITLPRQRKVSLKPRRTSITHSGRWVIQSSSSFRRIMTPKRSARPRGVIKLVNRRKKPEWKARKNREIENVNTAIGWGVFVEMCSLFVYCFIATASKAKDVKKSSGVLDTTKGVNWVRWSLNISSSFLLSDWLGQYCHFG